MLRWAEQVLSFWSSSLIRTRKTILWILIFWVLFIFILRQTLTFVNSTFRIYANTIHISQLKIHYVKNWSNEGCWIWRKSCLWTRWMTITNDFQKRGMFKKDYKSSRNDKYYIVQTAFLLENNVSEIQFKLLIRCEEIQCYFLKWGFSIYSFITLISFCMCFSYSFFDKH